MLRDLYNKISGACCAVTVFSGDELVSSGSGFAINADGHVLTAAHVVTGRWPIQARDYNDPNQRIFCKFAGLPVLEYHLFFCDFKIEVAGFTDPVQLDIAALYPSAAHPAPVPFLPAALEPPSLGQRVFVAGYSDELKLPFNVDSLLDRNVNGVADFFAAMEKGYAADMTGPIIKQGYVGNIRRVVAEDTKLNESVVCDVMYIDNSMHFGASGGPIVDEQGDAVGIITKRSITSAGQSRYPGLDVPSGCTIGLGLQPLLYIAKKTGGV